MVSDISNLIKNPEPDILPGHPGNGVPSHAHALTHPLAWQEVRFIALLVWPDTTENWASSVLCMINFMYIHRVVYLYFLISCYINIP